MAAGQSAAQEAVQQSMQYWGQMFELIADMQKRLFVLIEGQMVGVPGVKEAKAAMAMMPDLRPAKDLVAAMQGVMSSGGSTFESMQRVMGDFAKFAQQTMPGMKR
jgi:UDP-N-acetylglucosamine enolpyruvyl transferase